MGIFFTRPPKALVPAATNLVDANQSPAAHCTRNVIALAIVGVHLITGPVARESL